MADLQQSRSWRPPAWRAPELVPWLVFGLGVVITAAACLNQRHYRQLEHERIERELAEEISKAIATRLQTNVAILDAVVGLYNASSDVTRQEFAKFYQAIHGRGDHLKGIQGVGYAAVVPNNDVAAFQQKIRSSGLPDFTIKPPGKRPLTTAIVFLEPNDWRNQRAVGYDMYSQATRRAAMQLSANTGEAALSGPVQLLQETKIRPQVGALIYQAIYKQPVSSFASTQDRLQQLQGWAYSPLRMEDLINSALARVRNPALQGSDVVIYDGDKPVAEQLLYDNQNPQGKPKLRHPTWLTVDVAKRTWLIGTQLSHRNLSPSGWDNNLLLQAVLGLSLSTLAGGLSHRLLNNHLALREALDREQQASRDRALAATVFDINPLAILVTDADGMILRVNQAFAQLSGYSELEARGHKANLLRSGRHDNAFYQEMWTAIIQRGYWHGELWNRHRNGRVSRHELTIRAVRDEQERTLNYVGVLRDVSERHILEEKMRYLATHDQLTGLANRTLLLEELKRSLALAQRQNSGVALLFIDLDNFKPVNDQWGHATGDLLLKAVARRLESAVRSSDTLCRQGGDEFVLLVPDAPAVEQLLVIAWKLQQSLHEPFSDSDELPADVNISASIGIARWPDHAYDADGLLDAADSAMYRAKHQEGEHIATAEPDGRSTPGSMIRQ